MVVVFDYWNPVSENASFHDIDLYTWGPNISDALDAELVGTNLGVVPNETWVYHGTNRDIGHGATIIGYIPDYSLTGETDDEQDWLIVYDTWSATPFTAIAVPINHIGLLLFLEP